MKSIYLDPVQVQQRTARHEAFWRGAVPDYPITWITARDPKPGYEVPEPAKEEHLWTDVEYVIKAAHASLACTYCAGDALPVFNPWLGPDQVAAWLGAELLLQPRENTSWALPFVDDWSNFPRLRIDPENRWWKLYLEILKASAEYGKDKWITTYPDLHTGIDALCALRRADKLMADLALEPDLVRARMLQMTELWKQVVDEVTQVLAPHGQGYSNWTMGYSARRFLCIGQNDFTCMISPRMFEEFCLQDNLETCRHADCTLYHLDGPGAIKHLPALLGIKELTAIQWVQGASSPPPGHWIDLIRRIQAAGKSVQILYLLEHALTTEEMACDLVNVLKHVDVSKLFIWGEARRPSEADRIVDLVKSTCDHKHRRPGLLI